jgi:hypothetical protein
MKKRKNVGLNKSKVTIVSTIVLIFILSIVVMGRYIYNNSKNSYATSSKFYFASDLLDGKTHEYSNWNGKDTYKIYIDLYSYNYPNNLEDSDYNIDYTITVEDNEYVDFTIENTAGTTLSKDTIYKTQKQNTAVIKVTPKSGVDLSTVSKVNVNVTAKATRSTETFTNTDIPTFERELKGTFVLNLSAGDYTYDINDAEGDSTCELLLTNLSGNANTFKLSIDPTIVIFDLTSSELVKYLVDGKTTTQSVSGADYVKSLEVKIPAESTIKIDLYKSDSTQDYTYSKNSNISETSVVTVTVAN